MKKKTNQLGEILSGERTLKSYRRFITPYYFIRKAKVIIQYGASLAGVLLAAFLSPPTAVYVALLAVYFACLICDIVWLDLRDQRVYIDESEIVLKAGVALIQYQWAHIESFRQLPDNAIMMTFVNGSQATLKGLKSTDALIPLLKNHITEESADY